MRVPSRQNARSRQFWSMKHICLESLFPQNLVHQVLKMTPKWSRNDLKWMTCEPHMHTYIHAHIPTHIHTCMHTYTYTYIHTHMHTYILTYMHAYIHAHIRIYMHTYIHRESRPLWSMIHTETLNKKYQEDARPWFSYFIRADWGSISYFLLSMPYFQSQHYELLIFVMPFFRLKHPETVLCFNSKT